jgi:hypothetical protein
MCVIDFDEYCTVWRETERKARKQHECSCCRRRIGPGENYIVHFSICHGDVTDEKCCGDCEADRAEFANAHGGFRTSPGYFPDQVAACITEGDEEGTAWEAMLGRIEARRKARA